MNSAVYPFIPLFTRFIHPRWLFGISSINSMSGVFCSAISGKYPWSKVWFLYEVKNGMQISNLCLVFELFLGIRIPWCGIGEALSSSSVSACSNLLVRLESVLHARDRLLKPQAGRDVEGWALEGGHVFFSSCVWILHIDACNTYVYLINIYL